MEFSVVVQSSLRFAGLVALAVCAGGAVPVAVNMGFLALSPGASVLWVFLVAILLVVALAAVVMLFLGVWRVKEPTATDGTPVEQPGDPAWAALLVIKALIDSDSAKTMAPELKLAVIEDVVRRIVRIRFPEGEKPNKGDFA